MGPGALVHWPNIARQRMSNAENGADPCTYAYDAKLGWTSPPNCTSAGYDSTPKAPQDPGGSVRAAAGAGGRLVVRKGDEVADEEAWPAYLQGMIGRHVLNGGVGGYSLDQTVLRAERLARKPNRS